MRFGALVLVTLGLAACASPRIAPGPSASVRLPEPVVVRLASGIHALLLPDPAVPLVGFELRVRGVAQPPLAAGPDSLEQPGVASLVAETLRRGAGERDAAAFREDVERRGGRVWSSATPRSVRVLGEFLAEDAEFMLDIVGDVLLRPRFDHGEIERARRLAIDGVLADKDDPESVIGRYWTQWALGGGPLGAPVRGDEESLAAITPADVRAAWGRPGQPGPPGPIDLVVTGDLDVGRVTEQLHRIFGAWRADALTEDPSVPGVRSGVLLADKPDAVQTYFRFGGAGIPWDHPDHAARELANTVLGGRFTSRLNTALRIEAGLTYGAGSGFDDERGGLFAVRTYTAVETSAEAIDLALATYRRFRDEGLSQAELDSARAYLQGQYAPDHLETAPQAGSLLLDLRELSVPTSAVDTYFERLDAVTLVDVHRVIRAHFPREPLTWVVIGPAETLRPIVAPLGEVTEVSLGAPGFGPR